jgi:hypothetical protein
MCQELLSTITYTCGHKVEETLTKMPYQNCGGCGQVQKTERLGKSTKKTPCPDYIAGKKYVEVNGKWEKAAKVMVE